MIIGIDETGTFALESLGISFFVGVHLLTNQHKEDLNSLLVDWKNANSRLKNFKGEIKGSSLSEQQLCDFISQVLDKIPSLRITVVGTIPSEHKKKVIQFHRDHHLKSYDRDIAKVVDAGNVRLSNQYQQLRNWYGNLNYQLLLKTWTLGEMIGHSYVEHMIHTILTDTDRTLGEFSISIDQDFVKSKEHNVFWKDFLRNSFYNFTDRHPIPVISEWPDDHPYYQLHLDTEEYESGDSARLVIDSGHVFRNGCNFVMSNQCAEVQVADIIATIVSNYYNKGIGDKSYTRIRECLIPVRGDPVKLIRMSSEEESKSPSGQNPYELIKTLKRIS